MQSKIILLLLFCEQVWARAGGAGGGSSGGGGGSGDDFGLFDVLELAFELIPDGSGGSGRHGNGNYFVLILALIVLGFFIYSKFSDEKGTGKSPLRVKIRPAPPLANLSALGGEDPAVFTNKARRAFETIQQAWSMQDITLMRKFITDGVYQRFHAQFTMMKILGQKNLISNLQIHNVKIVKAYVDGAYQCVDVEIEASADDQFVCSKYPQLNSPGGRETFTEIWSFLRKRQHKVQVDVFHSENCPQCAAPLTGKLLETARCPYCSVYINNGEFDWVLSEITQSDGYPFAMRYQMPHLPSLAPDKILEFDPHFSKQILEDRASNALMQILIANVLHNVQTLKKIMTAPSFESFFRNQPDGHLVYDRLYTECVDFLGFEAEETRLRAYVGIVYRCHQFNMDNPPVNLGIDHQSSRAVVMVMVREPGVLSSKGSVYAGSCPHCGAPQKDSLSAVCSYCSGQLNDARLDWVVEDLMDFAKFRQRFGSRTAS